MNLEVSVKNYRCFGEQSPARLKLNRGITALIGSNNSGKSTLLRLFYEFRPLFDKLSHDVDTTASLFQPGLPLPPLKAVQDPWKIFHRESKGDLVISVRILRAEGFDETAVSGPDEVQIAVSHKNFQCHGRANEHPNDHLTANIIFLEKWRKVFQSLSRSLYIGPFRGLDEGLLYGQGGDLTPGPEFKRQVIELIAANNGIHRVCEEIRALFRFKAFDIRVAKDSAEHLEFYVNNQLVPIEELGSGLGQTLMILLRAQIHHPDYIFIDEPEAHLHASLQADFITTLSGFASAAMVFASHNVGLTKIAGDRTYSIRRDTDHNTSIISKFNPDIRLSEMVGEAGFSAQQIEGCTKVLLVEGPTEIRAIRQILRKMNAEHQIVLIPLGGGSMITANREDELREITRICNDVYCLIDSEKPSARTPIAADRIAFKNSCEKVGIDCHILERRAFENYLSEKAIQHYYGKGFRALGPYDELKSKNPAWQKVYNWKIARDMPLSDFEQNDLGKFLKKVATAPCRILVRNS
ncbi:MAG: AAA family ATPase [Verrucomicrobiales bacterium]|jgi:ABC-type cobalamin/Fe3+-siderophores transport system ATPase subunit|nr:AAA family ATPase [Verrucomicrobiales bacterium]